MLLIRFGGEQSPDILAYRHTYWKMTNLNSNWGGGSSKAPSELKKIFHRSGPISWKMMASGEAQTFERRHFADEFVFQDVLCQFTTAERVS